MEKNEITIYRSKARNITPLFFSLIIFLLFLGLLIVSHVSSDRLVLIGGAIFFGYIFILGVREYFLIKKPVIILNENGIEDKRLGCGLIKWSDVYSVGIYRPLTELLLAQSLKIELKNFDFYRKKLSLYYLLVYTIRGKLGINYFIIDFTGLERKFNEAYHYVQKHINN